MIKQIVMFLHMIQVSYGCFGKKLIRNRACKQFLWCFFAKIKYLSKIKKRWIHHPKFNANLHLVRYKLEYCAIEVVHEVYLLCEHPLILLYLIGIFLLHVVSRLCVSLFTFYFDVMIFFECKYSKNLNFRTYFEGGFAIAIRNSCYGNTYPFD